MDTGSRRRQATLLIAFNRAIASAVGLVLFAVWTTSCAHVDAANYSCERPQGCTICQEHLPALEKARRGTPAEVCTATTMILNDEQYSEGERIYVTHAHDAACACRRGLVAIETDRAMTLDEIETTNDPLLLKTAAATLTNVGEVGNRAGEKLLAWIQSAESPGDVRRVLNARVAAAYSWDTIEACRGFRTGATAYALNGTDNVLRARAEDLETKQEIESRAAERRAREEETRVAERERRQAVEELATEQGRETTSAPILVKEEPKLVWSSAAGRGKAQYHKCTIYFGGKAWNTTKRDVATFWKFFSLWGVGSGYCDANLETTFCLMRSGSTIEGTVAHPLSTAVWNDDRASMAFVVAADGLHRLFGKHFRWIFFGGPGAPAVLGSLEDRPTK